MDALPFQAQAEQTAFTQTVEALAQTLRTAPAGWLLVIALCWGRVAPERVIAWALLFALVLIVNLWLLARLRRAGPRPDRHARSVAAVAGLDGLSWGAVGPLLMGPDAALNALLGAVLCGVAAVNVPAYISWARAYRLLLGGVAAGIALGALLGRHQPLVLEVFVALTVFLLIMGFHTQGIGRRVVEGVRLQSVNADLTERLREALQHMQEQAVTDALTGLPNRRALDALFKSYEQLSPREHRALSLLVLDIDHFKRINDGHGHLVGDAVLRAFAQRVSGALRGGDLCARFGGEEFVVALPGTPAPGAWEVAERLRSSVAAQPLVSEPLVSATVSIGLAERTPGELLPQLLQRADTAVYRAKQDGRNRVLQAD